MAECKHLDSIKLVQIPVERVCEDCAKIGAEWVHLRTCQSCGVTRCCDQSPYQHATKHAKATQHHVIASAERDERWMYCYADDAFLDY